MSIRDHIVYLELTTWEGYTPGASHYYGKLSYDDERIELENDGSDDYFIRFESKADILSKAMRVWKELFPKATILVEGRCTVMQPQKVLICPDDKYMIETNSLYNIIEANYDRRGDFISEEVYDVALTEWEKMNKEYVEEYGK